MSIKITDRQSSILASAHRHRMSCFGQSRHVHFCTVFPKPSKREIDKLKGQGLICFRADASNYMTNTATGDITLDDRILVKRVGVMAYKAHQAAIELETQK